MWVEVDSSEISIPLQLVECSLTVRSCICWMDELAKIDKRLLVYFVAVALLHVARRISRNGFSDELMNILSTILERNPNQFTVLSRCKTELNTSELVELLKKSAVEHLATYRQLTARDFASLVTIVTTDFESLYAYKRGDYHRCLQLSTQNVLTLLYARPRRIPSVPLFSDFVQLFDDDIVSLIALLMMVNPECNHHARYTVITQLTLSLYLMTQCQLKLHHSVMSLAQTLDYIEVTRRRLPDRPKRLLNHFALKLIERIACLSNEYF